MPSGQADAASTPTPERPTTVDWPARALGALGIVVGVWQCRISQIDQADSRSIILTLASSPSGPSLVPVDPAMRLERAQIFYPSSFGPHGAPPGLLSEAMGHVDEDGVVPNPWILEQAALDLFNRCAYRELLGGLSMRSNASARLSVPVCIEVGYLARNQVRLDKSIYGLCFEFAEHEKTGEWTATIVDFNLTNRLSSEADGRAMIEAIWTSSGWCDRRP